MGFRAKRGDKVWVCYDGKRGRRQLGTVVRAGKYKMWITFTPWASDDEAPVTAPFRYESWGRIWGGPGRGFAAQVPEHGWYRVHPVNHLKEYLHEAI